MKTSMYEDTLFLTVLMKRASELLDPESELQPLKKNVRVPSNSGTHSYTIRNKHHSDLKRLLKDIRRETIEFEKRMERMNR